MSKAQNANTQAKPKSPYFTTSFDRVTHATSSEYDSFIQDFADNPCDNDARQPLTIKRKTQHFEPEKCWKHTTAVQWTTAHTVQPANLHVMARPRQATNRGL